MVSKEAQHLIMEAQIYQQQLQTVLSQKDALNMQLIESGKAMEELSKPGDDDIYKVVGPVLVKVKKADAKKDLSSKKELVMLRLKTLEKSETQVKKKLEEIKEKLAKEGV
jgi:prefoldin beta subunit